jgi:Thoeris protein ThsB, TIR-like domain
MAGRRTFFSFHYKRDVWRASNIRNCGRIDAQAAAGWTDASLWEATKALGDTAVKRAIENGLRNTSVTVVLIGAATSTRNWVDYEILRSYERGNSVIGVRIHKVLDQYRRADVRGATPQGLIGNKATIYNFDARYLGGWIEKSAIAVGHPCLEHGNKNCLSCRMRLYFF